MTVGKNPKWQRNIWRVKGRAGKLSKLFAMHFYAGKVPDITLIDYADQERSTVMTKLFRHAQQEAEGTTRRERVLLAVIGLIILGELFARVYYPAFLCG